MTSGQVLEVSATEARVARLLAPVGAELGIELRFVPGAAPRFGVPVHVGEGPVHGAVCWSGPLDESRLELVRALAAVVADELERAESVQPEAAEVDDPWAGEDERIPADDAPSPDYELGSPLAPATRLFVGGALAVVAWAAIALAVLAGGALALAAWAAVTLAAYVLYRVAAS
ncbi:MAG: hypothetical protein ACRDON_10860 [Gaiellaceae bacterium]